VIVSVLVDVIGAWVGLSVISALIIEFTIIRRSACPGCGAVAVGASPCR
jgi:hypothetical protein